MTVVALVPLLVAIGGALLYALAANPKLQELGRLAFAAGVFALCLALAGHAIRIG